MTPLVAVVYLFIAGPSLVNAESFDLAKMYKRSISTNFGPHSTYEGTNGLMCYVCRPGFHFVRDCTSNLTTAVCKECNSGTYNTNFNIAIRCATCTDVCFDKNAEVRSSCNATADAKCQCKDGYYNHSTGPNEWKCIPHTQCEPGKEPYRQGTSSYDTICRKCEKGYYSSLTSSTEICTQCSGCPSEQDISFHCNETADTLCDSKGQQSYNKVVLSVLIAVLVAAVIIAIILWKKTQKYRNNKNSEEIKVPIGLCVEPREDSSLTETLIPDTPHSSYCDQRETRPKPLGVPNTMPKAEWLQLITSLGERLTQEEWQPVIRTLYASYYDISQMNAKLDTINHDNPHNLKEQKYRSFIVWLQRAGADACLDDILSALECNSITRLDEELKERFPALLRNPELKK